LNSDADLIKVLRDFVYYVLKGNVKLKREESERLDKYKSDLRKFVYEKGNVKKKRKFLIQKGGWLPLLIPAAIDTINKQRDLFHLQSISLVNNEIFK
jgi:hypothetical protein